MSTCSARTRATCVFVIDALFDENLAQPLPGLQLLCERGRELLFGEQAVADEQRADSRPLLTCGFHSNEISAARPLT